MSSRRNSLELNDRLAAETAAAANLDKLLADFKEIFIYNSVRSELGTGKAVEALLNRGKHIFFPAVEGGEMQAVRHCGAFKTGAFGIREPECGDRADKRDIDVCVLPGLAFDLRGYRTGYGKGYYDRYLRGTECVKVGYCYDFQIVQAVDEDEWDAACDYIVTDKKIYRCGVEQWKNSNII